MKTAVISDIHSNLEALLPVLEHAGNEGVDEFVCLGDVVGYNADPNACVDLLRSIPNMRCVLGNHDAMAVGEGPLVGVNSMAAESVVWTRERLGDERKAWLAGLPLIITDADATYCHASLEEPAAWKYVKWKMDAHRHFEKQTTRLGFMGHSHIMFAWSVNGEKLTRFDDSLIDTSHGDKWLTSVGSVGQPRDNDQRAGYAIYDHDTGRITQFRVNYDIATAKQKILDSNLPAALADRLG